MIPSRDADLAGVGVAAAINGSHYKNALKRAANSDDHAEIALELSYAINVHQELVIQPDLQYIINPSTDLSVTNALAVGVRLRLNVN